VLSRQDPGPLAASLAGLRDARPEARLSRRRARPRL